MQVVCIACYSTTGLYRQLQSKIKHRLHSNPEWATSSLYERGKKKQPPPSKKKNIHKRGKMKGCKEWSVAITPWCFAIDPCRLPSWMRTLGNTAQPSCTQRGGSDHCLRLPPGKLGFNIKQEDVNQRYIAFLSQNRIKKSLCDYNS